MCYSCQCIFTICVLTVLDSLTFATFYPSRRYYWTGKRKRGGDTGTGGYYSSVYLVQLPPPPHDEASFLLNILYGILSLACPPHTYQQHCSLLSLTSWHISTVARSLTSQHIGIKLFSYKPALLVCSLASSHTSQHKDGLSLASKNLFFQQLVHLHKYGLLIAKSYPVLLLASTTLFFDQFH